MKEQNFDEIIINKHLIALYKFPNEDSAHLITHKNVRSMFKGTLPITQQNLVQVLPRSTFNNNRVPAFNELGAKYVKRYGKKIDDNLSYDSVHNQSVRSQILSLAQNFDYLTNDCVGYFDRNHTHLIAQFNSYDMNLTKANLGALTLNHNVNNSGILRSEIPALVKQAQQYPADIDFVIDHYLEPIYHLVGSKNGYHHKVLLGYNVIEKPNGFALACNNNRTNRILVKSIIKHNAKPFYKAYAKTIKRYLKQRLAVVRA